MPRSIYSLKKIQNTSCCPLAIYHHFFTEPTTMRLKNVYKIQSSSKEQYIETTLFTDSYQDHTIQTLFTRDETDLLVHKLHLNSIRSVFHPPPPISSCFWDNLLCQLAMKNIRKQIIKLTTPDARDQSLWTVKAKRNSILKHTD